MPHLPAERIETRPSGSRGRLPGLALLVLFLPCLGSGCAHDVSVLAATPTMGRAEVLGEVASPAAQHDPDADVTCRLNPQGDGYQLRVWVQSKDCKTLPSPPAVLHTYVGDKDFPGESSESFDTITYKAMLSGRIPQTDLFPPAPAPAITKIEFVFVARCGKDVGGDAQGRGECRIDAR